MDAVHNSEDGKDYILEMNDTSIGLAPQHHEEDLAILRVWERSDERKGGEESDRGAGGEREGD